MFKPSNRWHLPDLGKILSYGRSLMDLELSTVDFAKENNLGPDKASSYLEHLRACCVCEKDSVTRRYHATDFFRQALEARLGEADLVALLYFNYVHYMEPTRWLALELFDEFYFKGAAEVSRDLIMERYICERLAPSDDPKKHKKRINEAVKSLVGNRNPLQLSTFHTLGLYRENDSNIQLLPFIPSIKVFALSFAWAWRRNFGPQIFSLGISQIIRSIEFPFRTFRLSQMDSMAVLDELAHLRIVRMVKSADLEQVYFEHNLSEAKMYTL